MMSQDKNKKGYDPEDDKEVKKGALKPEHKNQYGEHSGGKDRDLSRRVKNEKNKD